MTYRHFLRDLQTVEKFSSRTCISTKSVWTDILLCIISVFFFYAQIGSFGEKKIMIYPFAVILTFLLPLDHEVDKMCLSHANGIWKYIMNLILFQIVIWIFIILQQFTLPPKRLKKVTLQRAAENPKKVCKNVCKSQNACPKYISYTLHTFGS